MRILHLLASPYWSGPAELVALLALEQRKLGHHVSVAIDRKRSDAPSEEPAAPRFEALGLLDVSGLELSVKSSPRRVLEDRRVLAIKELDVVHCHFSHDHFIARWGTPKQAVLVRSIHSPRSLRWTTPAADAFTVPSSDVLPQVRKRPACVLHALVDPSFRLAEDRQALRDTLQLPPAGKYVGMVSTFQPSRRHALGVEAFEQLLRREPDAHLVLVGDGQLLPQLKGMVEAKGLAGKVTFPGYQSGAAFVRWMQALDEVWVLGLGNDWSGRVAAQARACGVWVIAVALGGLSELADVALAHPDALAIARASSAGVRSGRPLPTNPETAEAVIDLYLEARR